MRDFVFRIWAASGLSGSFESVKKCKKLQQSGILVRFLVIKGVKNETLSFFLSFFLSFVLLFVSRIEQPQGDIRPVIRPVKVPYEAVKASIRPLKGPYKAPEASKRHLKGPHLKRPLRPLKRLLRRPLKYP